MSKAKLLILLTYSSERGYTVVQISFKGYKTAIGVESCVKLCFISEIHSIYTTSDCHILFVDSDMQDLFFQEIGSVDVSQGYTRVLRGIMRLTPHLVDLMSSPDGEITHMSFLAAMHEMISVFSKLTVVNQGEVFSTLRDLAENFSYSESPGGHQVGIVLGSELFTSQGTIHKITTSSLAHAYIMEGDLTVAVPEVYRLPRNKFLRTAMFILFTGARLNFNYPPWTSRKVKIGLSIRLTEPGVLKVSNAVWANRRKVSSDILSVLRQVVAVSVKVSEVLDIVDS